MLQTIDSLALSTVTGGNDNQVNVTGELDGELSGVGGLANLKVKGSGTVNIQRTNYGECLNTMKGRPTDEIVKACGMPTSSVAK